MSLECFQATLARVIADTSLVIRARRDDVTWLADSDLEPFERGRLVTMCMDDRMEVLCSLYRSNRLTALVRTVPGVVEALGERLGDVVTLFWRATPRTDMQFHAEGLAFCRYVASTNEDPMVTRALEEAESELEPRDRAAEHDPAGHDAVDHLTSRHAGGQPVGVGSW